MTDNNVLTEVEVAALFLELAQLKEKAEAIEKKLEAHVVRTENDYSVAGLTLKYKKPSAGTPLYKESAYEHEKLRNGTFDLLPYTTTTESVSWKKVCEVLGVTAKPGIPSPARAEWK